MCLSEHIIRFISSHTLIVWTEVWYLYLLALRQAIFHNICINLEYCDVRTLMYYLLNFISYFIVLYPFLIVHIYFFNEITFLYNIILFTSCFQRFSNNFNISVCIKLIFSCNTYSNNFYNITEYPWKLEKLQFKKCDK